MRTCAKIIFMNEQFLKITSIYLDTFLYYDCKEKSYAICENKDMIKWQKNNNDQLKIKYISQYEAKKISVSINKENDFNLRAEHFQMLGGQEKSLNQNLKNEIDKMKLNQTSRLEYIQDTIQKQLKILDDTDRFIYPELFKVIEDSIEQSRSIFAQESIRYETEISENETNLKNQTLDDAIKQQQDFTDFLKRKFKSRSYLDLPE